MAEVSAAELRASLCRRGPRPLIQSWDLVLLLRLDDRQLLDLHRRLTLAHRRGEDLATVPVPEGVARYQARLLERFIVEPPRRDRGRQVARDPGPLEAEQKLGAMVVAAKQASDAATAWLDQNARRNSRTAVSRSPRSNANATASRPVKDS